MSIAQTIPLADTWMHGGWGWGWMTLMMIGMMVFWGAIIFGAVWLIRGVVRGGSAPGNELASREGPVEILERRFAEGAITPEDYRARREVLVNGTAGPNGAHNERLMALQTAERRQS
jgi:putative membrane protein